MPEMRLSPRIAAIYDLQAALSEPGMKALGLSWTSFQLLSAVHSAGGSASQAEVARRLGVSPATLSESVSAHVAKGLLQRADSAADKRVKNLELTAEARRLLTKAMAIFEEVEASMLHGVAAGTVDGGLKLLDRCIANLEAELEKR